MELPTQIHLQNVKRISRYIKGTLDFGIFYTSSNDPSLLGYTYSDWAGHVDDRRSTSGNVFFLGNIAFTWSLQKSKRLLLSPLKKLSALLHFHVLLNLFGLEDYLENLATFRKILHKYSVTIVQQFPF